MMETKRCPYCGEEILATAKKCEHCGEWLTEETAPPAVSVENRPGFFKYYWENVWKAKDGDDYDIDFFLGFAFSKPMPRKRFWISLILIDLLCLSLGNYLLGALSRIHWLSMFGCFLVVSVAVAYVIFLVKIIELQVRRLRDVKKSPWLVVLAFIPVLNLVPIVMYFLKGSETQKTQWTKKDSRFLIFFIVVLIVLYGLLPLCY